MPSDLKAVQKHVPGVFATFLSNNEIPLKHDPERIAEAAMAIASLGRVPPAGMNGKSGKKKASPNQTLALAANDLIGFDRNRLDDPQKHIPNGRTLSKADSLSELLPDRSPTIRSTQGPVVLTTVFAWISKGSPFKVSSTRTPVTDFPFRRNPVTFT